MADTNGAERASPACLASERDLNGSASRPSDVKDLRIAIIGAGTLIREPLKLLRMAQTLTY